MEHDYEDDYLVNSRFDCYLTERRHKNSGDILTLFQSHCQTN